MPRRGTLCSIGILQLRKFVFDALFICCHRHKASPVFNVLAWCFTIKVESSTRPAPSRQKPMIQKEATDGNSLADNSINMHPMKKNHVLCNIQQVRPRQGRVKRQGYHGLFFLKINLNIKKMGSLSVPQIPNYPKMTFLFYKMLIISTLCFKV